MPNVLCLSTAHPYFDVDIINVVIRLHDDVITLRQMKIISDLQHFMISHNISFKYEIIWHYGL